MTVQREVSGPVVDSVPAGLSGGALPILLFGLALPVIDFFIVNVALPTIGGDLHAGDNLLELVVSGYALAFALLLVLGGRLGDAVGRKRLFLGGMAAFTATSALCGLAPDVTALIVGRVLQGASAAMMLPQVLATIHARTDGPARARAIGRYGATAGIGMVVGQLVGGVIIALDVAGSGWRGIFLVNVPVGLVGLVLAARLVPDTRADRPTPIDLGGTGLLAATLFCLLLPLSQGRTLGWPVWTWVLLAATVPFAGALVAWERRLDRQGRTPLLPPAVVGLATVRAGIQTAVPFFVGFGGLMFVYALATQVGLHLSAIAAGGLLVPYALAFFTASLSSPSLISRYGTRVLGVAAAGGMGGYISLAVLVGEAWPHPELVATAALLAVAGFAQGLIMSPLFGISLSQVPAHLAGAGSGVMVTTQQSSLALGVALIGTLYTSLDGRHPAGAAALVLAIEAAIALYVAVSTRRLPRRLG